MRLKRGRLFDESNKCTADCQPADAICAGHLQVAHYYSLARSARDEAANRYALRHTSRTRVHCATRVNCDVTCVLRHVRTMYRLQYLSVHLFTPCSRCRAIEPTELPCIRTYGVDTHMSAVSLDSLVCADLFGAAPLLFLTTYHRKLSVLLLLPQPSTVYRTYK